jgi:hypothetical protein
MAQHGRGAFGRQADRLYERGVAAARGGQRTVAAGLLRQAVKLNPQHELAWLWLGGVLDAAEDVAFCLRAVLAINPQNERAKRGLAQVSAQVAPQAAEPAPVPEGPPPILLPQPGAEIVPDAAPWWSSWRDAQATWRRTLRLVWLVPIILIATTLSIRAVILLRPLPVLALERPIPTEPAARAEPVPLLAVVEPEPVPTETPTVAAYDRKAVDRYLQQVRAEQERLQAAIQSYRKTTEQSRTMVERVAAARALSDELSRSRQAIEGIEPPKIASEAHESYLNGLSLEGLALQDLLTFYGNYDVSAANRAALRLQDARSQIDAGKTAWNSVEQQLDANETAPPAAGR